MKQRHRNRFRLYTVLQVLLIAVTVLALVWTLLATDMVAVPVVIGLVIALQIYALIHLVEAHVDSLEDFFAAVNYEDFTRRFVEEDVDAELKAAFNKVLSRFQEARAERDLQASYLETVVRHVPVPFVAVRADGSLSLVNKPLRRLTGLNSIKTLAEFAALEPQLPAKMQEIPSGEQRLVQTRLHGIPAELKVSVSEIRLDTGVERLYSVENLSGELTAREASAWRNLIRVLTHEIMNTLTPVTSLAESAARLVDKPDSTDDLRDAMQTIARRSEGLTNFVRRYREVLNVPQPVIATVRVSEALENFATLLAQETDAPVSVTVDPESLEIQADRALLDQVLINLGKNALHATAQLAEPGIDLRAELRFGRVAIVVSDNGAGIDPDLQSQIFVPFFTTKRDGSGIGLSLSKQIMSAHGGEIAVDSGPDGTRMTLIF